MGLSWNFDDITILKFVNRMNSVPTKVCVQGRCSS